MSVKYGWIQILRCHDDPNCWLVQANPTQVVRIDGEDLPDDFKLRMLMCKDQPVPTVLDQFVDRRGRYALFVGTDQLEFLAKGVLI